MGGIGIIWGGAIVFMLGLAVFGINFITRPLLGKLLADLPSSRSLHLVPTPKSGGIGMGVAAIVAIIAILPGGWSLAGLLAALWLVSMVNDWRDLSPKIRLAVHFVVGLGLLLWNMGGGGIGLFLLALILLPFVVAHMNFTNFMDGIDGLSLTYHSIFAAGALAIVYYNRENVIFGDGLVALVTLSLVMIGICLGAMPDNLRLGARRAQLFIGDSGAMLLGGLSCIILIQLALVDPLAIFILPSYYWTDTVITLGRRWFGGENIFLSHNRHAYQRAARGGMVHSRIVALIGLVQILQIFILFSEISWVAKILWSYGLALGVYFYLHSRLPGQER